MCGGGWSGVWGCGAGGWGGGDFVGGVAISSDVLSVVGGIGVGDAGGARVWVDGGGLGGGGGVGYASN